MQDVSTEISFGDGRLQRFPVGWALPTFSRSSEYEALWAMPTLHFVAYSIGNRCKLAIDSGSLSVEKAIASASCQPTKRFIKAT
jgi:hypothetical protein